MVVFEEIIKKVKYLSKLSDFSLGLKFLLLPGLNKDFVQPCLSIQ